LETAFAPPSLLGFSLTGFTACKSKAIPKQS